MHKMKEMMERLEGYACNELSKSENQVDTIELGQVVDMIKDCAETMYYYSIAEEMKQHKEDKEMYKKFGMNDNHTRYYSEYNPVYQYYPWDKYNDMNDGYYYDNRMYYNGNGSSSNGNNSNSGSRSNSRDYQSNNMQRDMREGRSGNSRRYYMEMKDKGSSTNEKMNQLENYMQELSVDITEMINDATPEEKTMLKQKLLGLHQKI